MSVLSSEVTGRLYIIIKPSLYPRIIGAEHNALTSQQRRIPRQSDYGNEPRRAQWGKGGEVPGLS